MDTDAIPRPRTDAGKALVAAVALSASGVALDILTGPRWLQPVVALHLGALLLALGALYRIHTGNPNPTDGPGDDPDGLDVEGEA